MLHCFEDYNDFELFAEKRLIFGNPRRERPKGSEPKKEKPGASEGLLGDIHAQLAELRGGVPPAKSAPSGYHRERRATGTITEPTPYYPESVKIAEKAKKLGSHLDRNEVLLMQMSHENLYRQYLNPAFMLYLKQQSAIDKPRLNENVYSALDLILNNPDFFTYINRGNDRVEIVKRRPYNANRGTGFSDIPNDFLVVMETKDGHITKVRSNAKDKDKGVDVDLKKGSDIPWISNKEYNEGMPLYQERWRSEHARYLYGDEYKKWEEKGSPDDEWPGIFKNSFEPISETIKAIHVANNIEFPKRFVAMVKARNLAFEVGDPGFVDVMEHQKDQGTTYDEITRDGYGPDGKLRVMVVADADPKLKKKFGAVYQIWTRKNRPNPLRVTAEGYILRQREDGSWDVDPRYHQAVRRGYYAKNPEAKVDLEEGEAKDMEGLDKKVGEAVKSQEKLKEQREKRKKVDEALKKAEVDKLRKVAKAISPDKGEEINKKRNEAIDEMDEKALRAGIKTILDDNVEANLNKAAAILEV